MARAMNNLSAPPAALLELATGYQRSKTLFALVEFGVPTMLAGRSLPLAEIAAALGVHPLAADRFLNAGVALGLLERLGDKFRNTALAEQFLVRDEPTYLGDQFALYDRASYPTWSDLAEKLRRWRPGATDDRPPVDADQGADSMRAQHNLAVMVGHALGQAYDFSAHRRMLDLGGGTAGMSLGVCGLHPGLRAVVYDLPEVAEVARELIRAGGMEGRIEVATGNFKTDELPGGFDLALLANLLSVASEATNRELLARVYGQLPEGGAVILSGWILDNGRTSPLIPVLFCLEDINWEAPDVERSAATYEVWLADAGFSEIERRVYCPPTSMIVGRKAGRG
jgi:3-hydroxy-5-methyl-1-naphthoate 3-O-methyltransferase